MRRRVAQSAARHQGAEPRQNLCDPRHRRDTAPMGATRMGRARGGDQRRSPWREIRMDNAAQPLSAGGRSADRYRGVQEAARAAEEAASEEAVSPGAASIAAIKPAKRKGE